VHERRIRLLALLSARDEMRFLPGLMANLAPHVDGIVALDDGSTDGSGEYLEGRPEVVELLRSGPGRTGWDELGNHRALLAAALRRRADWVLCIDADERVEREFRRRAEAVIAAGEPLGHQAYAVRLRELWDSPDQYRADGIWGRKAVARLFRALPDHEFDERPMHAVKAPLQGKVDGEFPLADLELFHLRMIDREDRDARRRRYEEADPEARWQPGIGYAYLTDERDLELRKLEPGRSFSE
jgi:glycosyltransferase involved in cell wall biosynthesis